MSYFRKPCFIISSRRQSKKFLSRVRTTYQRFVEISLVEGQVGTIVRQAGPARCYRQYVNLKIKNDIIVYFHNQIHLPYLDACLADAVLGNIFEAKPVTDTLLP